MHMHRSRHLYTRQQLLLAEEAIVAYLRSPRKLPIPQTSYSHHCIPLWLLPCANKSECPDLSRMDAEEQEVSIPMTIARIGGDEMCSRLHHDNILYLPFEQTGRILLLVSCLYSPGDLPSVDHLRDPRRMCIRLCPLILKSRPTDREDPFDRIHLAPLHQ